MQAHPPQRTRSNPSKTHTHTTYPDQEPTPPPYVETQRKETKQETARADKINLQNPEKSTPLTPQLEASPRCDSRRDSLELLTLLQRNRIYERITKKAYISSRRKESRDAKRRKKEMERGKGFFFTFFVKKLSASTRIVSS